MHAELYTLPDYTPGPPPLRAETEVHAEGSNSCDLALLCSLSAERPSL
jgi:hypothetical protein